MYEITKKKEKKITKCIVTMIIAAGDVCAVGSVCVVYVYAYRLTGAAAAASVT